MPLITLQSAKGYGWGKAGSVEINSFESIATVTLSSASNTITFNSIPSGYKHLQLRSVNLSSGSDNNIMLRFNSDSGNNYSEHAMFGNGSSTGSYASTSVSYASAGYTADATYPAGSVCDILDYSNANKNTTVRALGGSNRNGNLSYITIHSSAWYNTAAITRIDVVHGNIGGGKVFNTHSTFALYGIKG
jgi:hypothetical protein